MGHIIEKLILPPEEIIAKFPLNKELESKIKSHRESIINILEGKDKRKILVIGPCSAWPTDSVLEYAKKLQSISNKVSDKIKIILRIYTQKPRTTIGWTGLINQPNPFENSDIEKGIIEARKLMLEITKLDFPIADEAVFIQTQEYLSDLISFVAIGARSSEDQEHRIYASMLPHPVGMKNPTSGNIEIAINSVLAAQNPHTFLLNQKQIKTTGNKHTALILRGGNLQSNIYLPDLITTMNLMKNNISNPSMIIDVSHDNSIDPATGKKDHTKQPDILKRVIKHIKEDNIELNKYIKGFMVESFLEEGKQDLNQHKKIEDLNLNGKSITDGCIGFENTIKLINDIYKEL